MRSLTVSETARHLSRECGCTVSPQHLSNLFYKRYLDDARCPIIGRSRLIPVDYLPTIKRVLLERGLLKDNGEAAALNITHTVNQDNRDLETRSVSWIYCDRYGNRRPRVNTGCEREQQPPSSGLSM